MGERSFIFDAHSCRKNKGTHLAIKRLKKFIGKITENYKVEANYLQLDISGFFMNINHDILYSLLKKLILKQNKSYQWGEDVLWLAKTIIFCKPTQNYIIKGNLSLFKLIPPRKSLFESPANKGLPIGNYSSQFFANLYLNPLDQWIKRKLKCKYYIRYVDDLVLLGKSRGELKYMRNKISFFLKENLDLELNSKKTKRQSINKGIDFLGYFVKPSYTLIRQRVVKKFKYKLCALNQILDSRLKTADPKILAMVNSYYGHFKHAFSFNLRRDIWKNHLRKLRRNFLPEIDYLFLKIK
jgi:hypothetical protein